MFSPGAFDPVAANDLIEINSDKCPSGTIPKPGKDAIVSPIVLTD